MYCPKCGAAITAGITSCGTCGAGLQAVAAPAQPAPAFFAGPVPVYPVWNYATWGTRAIGYIVDGLLVGVGMAAMYLVVGAMLAPMLHGLCCVMILFFPIATLAVGLFNSVYLVAQRGFSIGQGLVKIKVVDSNGNLLTQGTAFIRLLVRVALSFVPFLPLLDLLWPLWDVRRQTLHDKAVDCYVINNPSGL